MAIADWLTLSQESGTGDAMISVSATEHTGRALRTSKLSVTAGSITRQLSISQAAKAEFATIQVNTTASAKGQMLTISGVSNSAKLTFAWDKDSEFSNTITKYTAQGTEQTNGVALTTDYGASAQYTYSFQITIPNNCSTSAKSGKLIVTCNGGQTAEVTIRQSAGAKVYGNPVITAFSYGRNVGANGSTPALVKTLSYYQDYTWNGVAGSGGRLTTGGTPAYDIGSTSNGATVDAQTGSVTANSLGTTYQANAANIGTVRVSVTKNGKTSSKTCAVYQEANVITISGVTVSGGAITASTVFAASGGSKTVSNVTAGSLTAITAKFTSGSNAIRGTHYTVGFPAYSWSVESKDNWVRYTNTTASSLSVSCDSLGTTIVKRTATITRTCGIIISFKTGYGGTGNGSHTGSASGTLSQTNSLSTQ